LLDPSNDPEFFWQVISGPPVYFYHISLQILNSIYKKFKNGKIPYSFLPSL
jgi:hypothetical protein